MAVDSSEMLFCEKCKKTMRASEFYGTNNLEKYPTGKLNTCKKCVTMHVDNWDSSTYMDILRECDVPYIPEEWNKLLQKAILQGNTIGSMTIIGKYLAKMKLKQYKQYRFKDTEYLQEVADKKIRESMERQGYEAAEIAKVIEQCHVNIPDKSAAVFEKPAILDNLGIELPERPSGDDYFAERTADLEINIGADLTLDDKRALLIKWGKSYSPEEWVKLEQLYNDMMNSYDIQSAGHIDSLKLLCKTSLKANQLLDVGDKIPMFP